MLKQKYIDDWNGYCHVLQTGDFLRHKIRGRQEKSDLLNMHILRGKNTFSVVVSVIFL